MNSIYGKKNYVSQHARKSYSNNLRKFFCIRIELNVRILNDKFCFKANHSKGAK